MGKIRILDPITANQIAAGEVVDRPASVVKELMENALDAGASEIRILVARGGMEEVRVLDNGDGMDREDLLLALRRHATSKISLLEQLGTLLTLGFRGEALPSIASVSRMILESCPDASGAGTRLVVEGGTASSPESAGHPRGTSITVRSLFFNAPARRKFLRSAGTETDQIAGVVYRSAVAHFDRRFTLIADGRELLDALPAPDRGERVRQIFGPGVSDRLLRFARGSGPYRVSGLASRPDFTRSTTRDQWLFVNGRPIRDRGLLHAVAEAYHTLLPRARHPFVLVFLEVPPERVDVNVHPAKSEVRLADPRAAHELVRVAIRTALEGERPVAPLVGFVPVFRSSPEGEALPDLGPLPGVPVPPSGRHAIIPPKAGGTRMAFGTSLFEPAGSGRLSAMVPLAQYHQSYIVASDSEGLVIVDQHVAHERVLYEQILRDAGRSGIRRQTLLFPLPLELDPLRARRLEEGRGELERLGFAVESFGPKSFLIREVPALLGEADMVSVLRDLADDLEGDSRSRSLDRIWDRLAATTACHAAVKVNFSLTREKMSHLLDELSKTACPMTCPHGRPVVLRLSHLELEKSFLRR